MGRESQFDHRWLPEWRHYGTGLKMKDTGVVCAPPGNDVVKVLPFCASGVTGVQPAGSVRLRVPASTPLIVHSICAPPTTTSCGPPLTVIPKADCVLPS